MLRGEAARLREMLLPVRRFDAVGAHVLARGGRVHEAAVAEVDADVGILLALEGEENEVAATQAPPADRARDLALPVRVVRKQGPGLAIAEHDQAAAIEARRG